MQAEEDANIVTNAFVYLNDSKSEKQYMLTLDIIRYIFKRAKELEEENQFNLAIEELKKISKIISNTSSNDNRFQKVVAYLNNRLGTLYYRLKDFDVALNYHQQDLESSNLVYKVTSVPPQRENDSFLLNLSFSFFLSISFDPQYL